VRPTYALAALVIVANTFNVGADIGGMAAAANLLAPIPVEAWVIFFGLALIAAQVWLSYVMIAGLFKWLTLVLFAYIISSQQSGSCPGRDRYRTDRPLPQFDAAIADFVMAATGFGVADIALTLYIKSKYRNRTLIE
jgi:Mn2+/Fe2+ NRAMP family transporter